MVTAGGVLFAHRIDLWRVAETPEGPGGFRQTWQMVQAAVPCRIAEQRGAATRGISADRYDDHPSRKVYFPVGTLIAGGDRLRRANGETFEVLRAGDQADGAYVAVDVVADASWAA